MGARFEAQRPVDKSNINGSPSALAQFLVEDSPTEARCIQPVRSV
jgi:hypothetical protein